MEMNEVIERRRLQNFSHRYELSPQYNSAEYHELNAKGKELHEDILLTLENRDKFLSLNETHVLIAEVVEKHGFFSGACSQHIWIKKRINDNRNILTIVRHLKEEK